MFGNDLDDQTKRRILTIIALILALVFGVSDASSLGAYDFPMY